MKRVHRFVTNDFTVRVSVVNATTVVQEMQIIQNSYPLATVGIGRAMVGALLMSSHLKSGQEVGLLFKGNGPISSIYAEASYEGHVRGYCPQPDYEAPPDEDPLNLGRALGNGTLSVTRHQPFQRQPFHGTVEMTSGEVGEDLAHYLHQSQQIRSIINLGVYLDSYGKVKAAGGLLIEVMPGVEDTIVDRLEKNRQAEKANISEKLLKGISETDLIAPYLLGLPYTEIPHEHEIKYFCPCTVDRVKRALSLLGTGGLQEIIEEDGKAQITCQICGRHYVLNVQELEDLKNEVRRQSLH